MDSWFESGLKLKDLIKEKKEKIFCLICNDEIINKKGIRKYCSKECSKKANKITVEKRKKELVRKEYKRDCLKCKKGFVTKSYNKKFCSFQCRHEFHLKGNELEEKYCSECWGRFNPRSATQKFCSPKCSRENRLSTDSWLKLRFGVLKRDDFTCKYCGRNSYTEGVKLHVDHIYPKSLGGVDEIHNLVTSCFECNLGKSDVVLDKRIMEKIRLGMIKRMEEKGIDQCNY